MAQQTLKPKTVKCGWHAADSETKLMTFIENTDHHPYFTLKTRTKCISCDHTRKRLVWLCLNKDCRYVTTARDNKDDYRIKFMVCSLRICVYLHP